MDKPIANFSELTRLSMPEQLVGVRRLLHRHAEPGWCEVFAASNIAETLQSLGWEVKAGAEVVDTATRMGLPDQETLDSFYHKAVAAGAPPGFAEKVRNGFTGVVGVLKGPTPGPTVAFRFDIDANSGQESCDHGHKPIEDGFASVHDNVHHNCGHDGHTSIGLGLARELAGIKNEIVGEIRLIFQPAEEGLRGAKSMVKAGVVEDVEHFVSCHLGVQALRAGEIISGYNNILGSTKIDVEFTGRSAHAGISPHVGRNAILAACMSVQGLLALPRHGDGETRVNVGSISGGGIRNAIPSSAKIEMEVRADDEDVLKFLEEGTERVIEGAAIAQNVTFDLTHLGASCPASSDPTLAAIVAEVAEEIESVDSIRHAVDFKGSDDAAEMMRAVENQGGKAVYFGIGSELGAVHHNPDFDFNEASLMIGLKVMMGVARRLGGLSR